MCEVSELADVDLTVVAFLKRLSRRAAFRTRLAERIVLWIAETSMHGIANSTPPAVERDTGSRAFGWCSQVKVGLDLKLRDANAQRILLC